jgi:hypothetical protein
VVVEYHEQVADAGDIDTYFSRLGRTVDDHWSASGRHFGELARIAARALGQHPVPETLDAPAILARLAMGVDLPRQRPASDPFGQPPAMFYRNDGLEVQALTWMEGTTSIHQHGFDGAFRVLCGSSLHVQYSFDCDEKLADGHLIVGALKLENAEVLRAGDTRAIVSGPEFIHALFHLERPSVTIVVRNKWSDLPFPQYDYRRPGLGIDTLFRDDELEIRLRALHSLNRLDADEALRVTLEMVRTRDLWTAYRLTDHWFHNFGEGPRFEDLAQALIGRDSSLGPLVGPMYQEQRRINRILSRRSMLHETRHRMFLALLVNLPSRSSIYQTMGQLFPEEDPDQFTLTLVEELASPELRGISGLRMGPEDLGRLRARLAEGVADEALNLVSDQWRPPNLLESLVG